MQSALWISRAVKSCGEPVYRGLDTNGIGSPEERFNGTPTVVNDQLMLRSDKTLYCIAEIAGT